MKKQRNHSQLKDQQNYPERTNNEADLFSLIDTDFKKEAMEILKELRKAIDRAFLVVQWLRVCLPMQGTRVRALVWEDPTCRRATRPVSHNY